MKLIRHRASNQDCSRPVYLTLHINANLFVPLPAIDGVDWGATTVPSTFPSFPSAFHHLKFPLRASHDCKHNSSSQSHEGRPPKLSFQDVPLPSARRRAQSQPKECSTSGVDGNTDGRNNDNISMCQYFLITRTLYFMATI